MFEKYYSAPADRPGDQQNLSHPETLPVHEAFQMPQVQAILGVLINGGAIETNATIKSAMNSFLI